jgi:hypothetical protein
VDEVEMMMTVYYHITVEEHLDDRWSTWFDGLTITHDTDGMSPPQAKPAGTNTRPPTTSPPRGESCVNERLCLDRA